MACPMFPHIKPRLMQSRSIGEAACGWMNWNPASRRRYGHDADSSLFLSNAAAPTFGACCGFVGCGAGLFFSSAAYVFATGPLEPDGIRSTVELESHHQRRQDFRQSKCGPSHASVV